MNGYVQGDPMLCIGCRTCMVACVVAHEGKRIFEIDPDGYDFHPKLSVVKTWSVSVPVQCKHCENPACLSVCRPEAISRQGGAVTIDRDKCIGCKSCAEACPFGAIQMVALGFSGTNADGSPKVVANKCDLCPNEAKGPSCVRVCPTECLRLVKEDDLSVLVKNKRQTSVNLAVQAAQAVRAV